MTPGLVMEDRVEQLYQLLYVGDFEWKAKLSH